MTPPEKVREKLVQEWLRKAGEDFDVAEYLVSRKTPYLSTVGFHAQQAAEKFLKALLTHHQIDFPKTHDLDAILDLLETVNAPLTDSLREVTSLSIYGVATRYPGNLWEMTSQDTTTAMELAAKVREAVLGALNE